MSSKKQQASSNQFGTFGGVFTPSILTILGVVMFMIMGRVTGQAGIFQAVMILLIAKTITFLTGLSISAISTNTRVEGGGAYFLISRSLGPEFGASIGLALFLAQALSVPFYVLGFVGALTTTQPQLQPYFVPIGMGVSVALFVLNYVGSSWALRAQYIILAALVGSIIAYMGGGLLNFEVATFNANWSSGYTSPDMNFWAIFAVFFPAVTGIMAGVNMSGDLKDPAHSIPRGTLMAILVGGVIYLLQILVMGGALERETLIDKPYESLLASALFGMDWLVVAGVYAATISSAIGSMMGAPRILQALARDRIFPVLAPFARGTEVGDEPRNGLWLTLGMTFGVLLIAGNGEGGGGLEAVASVLTMFFLFTYGMTNAAAFIEQLSRNPSFRPRFRYFHWVTALLGGLGCFGAAFLINPLAALGALIAIGIIFFYISRRVLETAFGDARRGFVYERVRVNLKKLSKQSVHPKNWRPTTLVLSGNPASRLTLTRFAGWLAGGSGIVTLANIIVGDVHEKLPERKDMLDALKVYIETNALDAYADVHISPNFESGLAALLQSHSIGPLKPNMLMFGWPSNPERAETFGRHLRMATQLEMSQVILFDRGIPQKEQEREMRIDVWWRGLENGSLMVLLAHLLIGNLRWRTAKIRLIHQSTEDEVEQLGELREALDAIIAAARLDCEVLILAPSSEPFTHIIHTHSADADAVFLGFRPPADDAAAQALHAFYTEACAGLPTTLLIHSSGDADLLS